MTVTPPASSAAADSSVLSQWDDVCSAVNDLTAEVQELKQMVGWTATGSSAAKAAPGEATGLAALPGLAATGETMTVDMGGVQALTALVVPMQGDLAKLTAMATEGTGQVEPWAAAAWAHWA